MDKRITATMQSENEMDGYEKIDQYNPHTVVHPPGFEERRLTRMAGAP